MRRAALLLIALAACDPLPLPAAAPQLDMTDRELAQPGVICARGLRFEADRGCTGDGGGGAAVLRIVEEMRMSKMFVPVRALYVLDGRSVLYHWREGKEARRERTPIFDATVPEGEHELSVRLEYVGHGEGVFAYLKGYRFQVRSSHGIRLPAGATTVTVVAHEKGGPTTPMEERPAVDWNDAR